MRCRVCHKELVKDGGKLWMSVERTPNIVSYNVICNFDRNDASNWQWHIPYSFNDYYNQLNDLLKL